MKTTQLLASVLIVSILFSCNKDDIKTEKYEISGYAQKGPFNTGATITVSELSESLKPTGLNFYSSVFDKTGSFTVSDVLLQSDFVELMADGFYFNENRGSTTDDRLVLKAIADVSENAGININILTHISAERIKYLVEDEGMEFSEAKDQAQNEILKIFSLGDNNDQDYVNLDIAKEGILNSKLLAISSIIQSNKTVSALTEILTEIAYDIKTNGTLDSEELKTELVTSAILCNIGGIRRHLAEFYSNDTVFNDFQVYVKYFIDNTDFEPLIQLNYPEDIQFGRNLLSFPDDADLDTASQYSLNLDIHAQKLTEFRFWIAILKTSVAGSIEYTVNDLSGWTYETPYCSFEDERMQCGIIIITESINLTSLPLTLKLAGKGELLIRMCAISPSLPDYGGVYFFEKTMKW